MCASRREPVHAAAEAAQRALGEEEEEEEEEEARLASASLAAGDPTGWSTACTPRVRAGRYRSRGDAASLIRCWLAGPARRNFQGLAGARWWLAVPWVPTPNTSPPSASTPPASTFPAQPSGSPGSASPGPPSGMWSLTCSVARRPGCAPTTWSSRSSRSRRCPTRPADRPSPTSAAWSDLVERCLPLPPFTVTTRLTRRSRPGHCGAPRSKRSAPTD
jgi:hypothetical protein